MSYNKQIKWTLLHLSNSIDSIGQSERDLRKALSCADAPKENIEFMKTGLIAIAEVTDYLTRVRRDIVIHYKKDDK